MQGWSSDLGHSFQRNSVNPQLPEPVDANWTGCVGSVVVCGHGRTIFGSPRGVLAPGGMHITIVLPQTHMHARLFVRSLYLTSYQSPSQRPAL